MANSKIYLQNIGEVVVVRRRGLKNISLRVDHSGVIRLNLPWFVPKATGLAFVRRKKDWLAHQIAKKIAWTDGREIGDVIMRVNQVDKSRSSWSHDQQHLIINLPKSYSQTKNQDTINKIAAAYLKIKTEEIIIPKAYEMAEQYGQKVNSVAARKFKSRWGSCDHRANIKLSLYLFTLPEHLWIYVICHELAHINHLNHSPKFWQTVGQYDPNYKANRKQLRDYNPNL